MKRTFFLTVALLVIAGTQTAHAYKTSPTFSHDVAKIVHGKCTICHRPDSSGPFSLITYDDVQRRAQTIEAVLESNYMPPWKPVDHGIAFDNSRSLSKEERQTIEKWIAAGCPEGDRTQTPAPPEFKDGWTLGTPDMVVKMSGKFEIPADGPDLYRSFVFPLNLPDDKWVKAVELRPRAKSAVHHAIFFLDTSGNARKLDGADGKPGISGMGFLADFGGDNNAVLPPAGSSLLDRFRRGAAPRNDDVADHRGRNSLARGLGGYVPGSTPNLLPGDLAMALPRGSDVVMQTHFHPSGKVETEEAELALYFAKRPPSKMLIPVQIPPMFGFGSGINIPAGEKNFRIEDTITLPVDTQAIGVGGHAHYICREMKLTAKLPQGETLILLEINDWDLDWQDQYIFAKPVYLPAGTVLHVEIVYDNSADNPENPHHPPQVIRWGRGSNDEMGSITLMTIANQRKDELVLQNEIRKHFVAALVDRKGPILARMLLQLDDDGDGILQRSEAPPRINARIFGLADTDKSGGLDLAEIERLMKLRDQVRGGGNP